MSDSEFCTTCSPFTIVLLLPLELVDDCDVLGGQAAGLVWGSISTVVVASFEGMPSRAGEACDVCEDAWSVLRGMRGEGHTRETFEPSGR